MGWRYRRKRVRCLMGTTPPKTGFTLLGMASSAWHLRRSIDGNNLSTNSSRKRGAKDANELGAERATSSCTSE